MVQKEAAAAELQKSMDRALEEKLKIQEEIEKLNKMGDAAGKKQVRCRVFWRQQYPAILFISSN